MVGKNQLITSKETSGRLTAGFPSNTVGAAGRGMTYSVRRKEETGNQEFSTQ